MNRLFSGVAGWDLLLRIERRPGYFGASLGLEAAQHMTVGAEGAGAAHEAHLRQRDGAG